MSRGGDEHVITHGPYAAVVTEVGAGLRTLTHDGRDLVRPYLRDEVRPRFRGVLLAPWPNRVVDGRYRYGGETLQLDLSEPERGHALHGLVCWARFEVLERDGSSVTVRHSIVPRTGYPFEVAVQARYELADDGLTVTVTAENLGGSPAPYGVGSHPYLVAGDGGVDAWTLELPATEVLEVTEERLVPTGRNAVAEAGFDFRSPGRLAGVEIDHAFTGLVPDDDGLVRARVRAADGGGVQCTWDGTALPWVQVHTADLPPPEASRAGLALEPMSCPPDAFNSGTDLRTLQPGEGCADTWMISAL